MSRTFFLEETLVQYKKEKGAQIRETVGKIGLLERNLTEAKSLTTGNAFQKEIATRKLQAIQQELESAKQLLRSYREALDLDLVEKLRDVEGRTILVGGKILHRIKLYTCYERQRVLVVFRGRFFVCQIMSRIGDLTRLRDSDEFDRYKIKIEWMTESLKQFNGDELKIAAAYTE